MRVFYNEQTELGGPPIPWEPHLPKQRVTFTALCAEKPSVRSLAGAVGSTGAYAPGGGSRVGQRGEFRGAPLFERAIHGMWSSEMRLSCYIVSPWMILWMKEITS